MKIVGISFSYSKDSMALRGLKLMDHYLKFTHLHQIDLTFCDSNKPDGVVPDSVHRFTKILNEADVLVFSVPEYSEHYSAAFKNALDWLVVESSMNSTLGQQYSISNKPTYVITFTPAKVGAGHRHFDITQHALEKLGADVKELFVKNDGWDNVIRNNFQFVDTECARILNTTITELQPVIKKDMSNDVPGWNIKYNNWNEKWK